MIKDYYVEDFIGVFDTTIDCKKYIEHFNYLKDNKCVFSDNPGQRSFRKDHQTFIHSLLLPDSSNVFSEYNELTYECLKRYLYSYNNFMEAEDFQQPYMKIQMTEPTGGYHQFHTENMEYNTTSRVMVSMLYLNDVEEGGETEFLFLSKRFSPKKGRFLIFPAGYTHIHRGNPPLKENKYIVTSWIERNFNVS